uniref:Putative secreted protein n=1 Tax=Anopheles darlingi TaxID=43151 RepID=A0A2M4D1Q4_ANODA
MFINVFLPLWYRCLQSFDSFPKIPSPSLDLSCCTRTPCCGDPCACQCRSRNYRFIDLYLSVGVVSKGHQKANQGSGVWVGLVTLFGLGPPVLCIPPCPRTKMRKDFIANQPTPDRTDPLCPGQVRESLLRSLVADADDDKEETETWEEALQHPGDHIITPWFTPRSSGVC